MDDELFVLDDLEPLELDELELLELVLPLDEDELEDSPEEVLANDLAPAREKLNLPTFPLPEVRSNSGMRIAFSRDEYLMVTPLRLATLTSGFQSLNRPEVKSERRPGRRTKPPDSSPLADCDLLIVSFVSPKIQTEGLIDRLWAAVPPEESG